MTITQTSVQQMVAVQGMNILLLDKNRIMHDCLNVHISICKGAKILKVLLL